jgi:hypothetical protein
MPLQRVPHLLQQPLVFRFQRVNVYCTRPMSTSPQAWQKVLLPASSITLPV